MLQPQATPAPVSAWPAWPWLSAPVLAPWWTGYGAAAQPTPAPWPVLPMAGPWTPMWPSAVMPTPTPPSVSAFDLSENIITPSPSPGESAEEAALRAKVEELEKENAALRATGGEGGVGEAAAAAEKAAQEAREAADEAKAQKEEAQKPENISTCSRPG